ncbi:MAG: prepilin-type N-terminal cleavage/methylation domain-containing protein [Phycisphaerales bacterium]|jgi:prepilin-type N-terminal cleavage/methylation domain-containing protein|nr:prepilin-type N-terminal cleavage/methylation domain-containing protein [Phycisphaerales bacterium]
MTITREKQLRSSHRGLTLPELMIGLCIMAIVMGALGAFSSALATGWRQSELIQDDSMNASQVTLRLQSMLRNARLYGLLVPGRTPDDSDPPAMLAFWMSDDDGDSQMKLSEVGLLEHNPSDQTLLFYRVVWPDSYSAAQKASFDQHVSYANLNDNTFAATFKALPYVSSVVLARGVAGFRIAKQGVALPAVSYVLTFDREGRREVLAGSATIRAYNYAPTTQP